MEADAIHSVVIVVGVLYLLYVLGSRYYLLVVLFISFTLYISSRYYLLGSRYYLLVLNRYIYSIY